MTFLPKRSIFVLATTRMFYFFQTYGVCKLTKRIIVMNRKTRLPVALIAAVFPLLSAKHGSIAAEPAYSATEQLPRLYESAARRTANRTAPKLSAKKPSANSEFYNEHDLNAALPIPTALKTAQSFGRTMMRTIPKHGFPSDGRRTAGSPYLMRTFRLILPFRATLPMKSGRWGNLTFPAAKCSGA